MSKSKWHDGNPMVVAYCLHSQSSSYVASISWSAMGSAGFCWSSLYVSGTAISWFQCPGVDIVFDGEERYFNVDRFLGVVSSNGAEAGHSVGSGIILT